ncbi:YvrJ family protein [Tissierella pigra]|uniref:YvrJ family protein n=1 Tax=Tissierella pigra TaxID=2607614 RepID=A0A6N7XS33_9FIRM|nr:YvrJ family protein [Tissierella pigra]MBU5427899.1 YvrJ family protein [Tissierella pigra]MSU00223.1 YvrJ family protein [Tissierella pigra]
MEEIYSGIANLGFPIVLSIYLLVRIEGKLNQLSESITELSKTIADI